MINWQLKNQTLTFHGILNVTSNLISTSSRASATIRRGCGIGSARSGFSATDSDSCFVASVYDRVTCAKKKLLVNARKLKRMTCF